MAALSQDSTAGHCFQRGRSHMCLDSSMLFSLFSFWKLTPASNGMHGRIWELTSVGNIQSPEYICLYVSIRRWEAAKMIISLMQPSYVQIILSSLCEHKFLHYQTSAFKFCLRVKFSVNYLRVFMRCQPPRWKTLTLYNTSHIVNIVLGQILLRCVRNMIMFNSEMNKQTNLWWQRTDGRI